MVEYRRKYNGTHKTKNAKWLILQKDKEILSPTWYFYEIRIGNKIYTSPSTEFINAYNKIKMWRTLQSGS